MKTLIFLLIYFYFSTVLFSQDIPNSIQQRIVQYAKDSLIKEVNIGDIFLNESRFCFPMNNAKISGLNFLPFHMHKNYLYDNDSGYIGLHYIGSEKGEEPKFYYSYQMNSNGVFKNNSKVYNFVQHTNYYKSEACSTEQRPYKSKYDTFPIKLNYIINHSQRIKVMTVKFDTLKDKVKLTIELENKSNDNVNILNSPINELSLHYRNNYNQKRLDSIHLKSFEIFDKPIKAKSKVKFKKDYSLFDTLLPILLNNPLIYYVKEDDNFIYGASDPISSNTKYFENHYHIRPIKVDLGSIFHNEDLEFNESIFQNYCEEINSKQMLFKFNLSNKYADLYFNNNGLSIRKEKKELQNFNFQLDTQIQLFHQALKSTVYPKFRFSLKYRYSTKPRIERKLSYISNNRNLKIIKVLYKNSSEDTVYIRIHYSENIMILSPYQEKVKIDTLNKLNKNGLHKFEILFNELNYFVTRNNSKIYGTLDILIPVDSIIRYTNYPQLVLDTNICDFGTIVKYSDDKRKIRVKNMGNQPLLIINCSGSVAYPTCPREPILPNATTEITIIYPTEREGPINKQVTIFSNDPVRPYVTIQVRGYIKNNESEKENDCY